MRRSPPWLGEVELNECEADDGTRKRLRKADDSYRKAKSTTLNGKDGWRSRSKRMEGCDG